MLNRRKLLYAMAVTGAALRIRPAIAGTSVVPEWPIAIFEKVFEGLNYFELANAIENIGADGVEATIRPGGHIEPEASQDEVPKMAEALAARGKRIVIAATGIRSADEKSAEPLLRTLVDSGVTHYRMSHYHYDLSRPIVPQLRDYSRMLRDLAALNKQVGIQGLYQNHSGGNSRRGYVGALGMDLATMLDGIAPESLGIAFDTRHLRKDTGSSWETAVAACKPHIRSIYVKDGIWEGTRGDEYKDVPLDTGFVNETVFNTIRSGLPPMPLCIHMEWLGYRVFEKHEIPDAVDANRRDLLTLQGWLKSAG